jgi:2,3-dihydroxybenzoate-AMP ligase
MEGFTPWPDKFARKYREEGYWLDKTISEVMDESFRQYSTRTALISDRGTEFTYSELGNLVTRLALHLNALGLRLYDRVVLQIPNVPEAVITYLAILKAGGIPIMALPAHREAEIGYFAKFSEASGIAITSKLKDFEFQEMAIRVQAEAPALKLVLVTNGDPRPGFHSIDELLKDPIEERIDPDGLPRPEPDLPAVMQLSGGTTGIPKLIPRTNNDYVYNFLRNAEICELDEDTVLLTAVPQEHNFAIACPGFKGVISRGGCEVLTASPSPKNMVSLIQNFRVTHWIAVPTMILGLLNYPQREDYDLSTLKVILTGGSKLNPEVAMRIGPELHCDVQQVLGMAEGPLFWTRLDDSDDVKMHTQGRPQSPGDEFKIMDPETGKKLPQGEVGELWCRGPYTIRGYYRAPEHNEKAFTEDGFYKSGDLVRLHPSGNVVVEGRIKDTINRGGEKISAEEVENHILAHPDVDTCAYVAMPDPLLGERACTYIVLRPGKEMTLDSLNEYLLNQRKIAKFKLPERLELVEALPLTHVGKINKKQLREMIATKVEEELASENKS